MSIYNELLTYRGNRNLVNTTLGLSRLVNAQWRNPGTPTIVKRAETLVD